MSGSIVKIITINNVRYICLDYIASSGTQFIDTGVKLNRSQPTAEMKFKDLTVKGNLFGTYNGYNAWYNGWGLFNNRTIDGYYYIHYKSNQRFSARTDYATIRMDRNKIYLDGTLIFTQGTIDSYVCNNTLYMLSGNFGETRKAEIPTLKIEYFKVWLDDVLVRDFIPVERISDNAVGMLDLVSNNFYGNNGTGVFTGKKTVISKITNVGSGLEVSKITKVIIENNIPYASLAYIQSNGSAVIDTGVSGKNTIRTLIEYEDLHTSGNESGWLFGSRTSASSGAYGILIANGAWRFDFGNKQLSTGFSQTIERPITIDLNKRVLTVKNGNTQLYQGTNPYTGTFNNNLPIRLFDLYGQTDEWPFSPKMKSCKMYDNDELVRDFIPVMRMTDNEIGMFDKVNKVFYGNSGTGAFTSGYKKEIVIGGD